MVQRRKTTSDREVPVPGSSNDLILIDTVSYIAQYLHEVSDNEEDFVNHLASYDFAMIELKEALSNQRSLAKNYSFDTLFMKQMNQKHQAKNTMFHCATNN